MKSCSSSSPRVPLRLLLPFNKHVVDCEYFFEVEQHQRINFQKQVGSSLEMGVSENHLLFKQNTLQTCIRRFGPTMDLLRVSDVHKNKKLKQQQTRKKRRQLNVSPEHILTSPVKDIRLNTFKRSFDDMTHFMNEIDEMNRVNKRVRRELKAYKDPLRVNQNPLRVQQNPLRVQQDPLRVQNK